MYILALDSWYLLDIHVLVTHNGLGTPRTLGLRAGSGSTAPRSGCSEPPPSPSRRTPAQAHTVRTARAVLCSLTSLNVSHGTKSSGGSRVCVRMPTSCRSASPRVEAAHCSILAAEVVTIPRPDRHLAAASGGLGEAMMQWIRGTYSLASGTSQHGQ